MTTPSFLLMSFREKFFNSLDRIMKNKDVFVEGNSVLTGCPSYAI